MSNFADREKWSLALRKLNEALRLLDESEAPPEIGAELDHAIHRLQSAIESAGPGVPRPQAS